MFEHEQHSSVEVRVAERRRCDEEPPSGRFSEWHATIVPWSSGTGSTPGSGTTIEQVDIGRSALSRPDVALGLDLGASILLVGQSGFDGPVINALPSLGRWHAVDALPTLALSPHLLAELLRNERLPPERVGACVAVPAWFGLAERHDVAEHVAEVSLGVARSMMVATPVCLALSTFDQAPRMRTAVLAVDARVGCGVSIVSIDEGQVVELGAAGVAPAHRRDLGDLVYRVFDRAARQGIHGFADLSAMVVLSSDDDRDTIVRELLQLVGADGPILVIADAHAVARGAVLLGNASTSAWHPIVSGGLLHAIGVGSDGAALVEANAFVPVSRRRIMGVPDGHDAVALVELRPTEFEAGVAGRIVAEAVLARGVRPDEPVELTVAIGVDGRTAVSPSDRWSLRLPPAIARSVRIIDLVPPTELPHDEPEPVVPIADSGAVAAVVVAVGAVGVALAGTRSAPPLATALAAAPPPAPPPAPTPALAPAPAPAVYAVLRQVERCLSEELGLDVAVRSDAAVLDLADDASPAERASAGDRLLDAVADRTDELADALRAVVALSRSTPEVTRWGGPRASIDDEIFGVVDHLRMVVGTLAEPERRRLIHDALMLGLDHQQALATVERALAADAAEYTPATLDVVGLVGRAIFDPVRGRFVVADATSSRHQVGLRLINRR